MVRTIGCGYRHRRERDERLSTDVPYPISLKTPLHTRPAFSKVRFVARFHWHFVVSQALILDQAFLVVDNQRFTTSRRRTLTLIVSGSILKMKVPLSVLLAVWVTASTATAFNPVSSIVRQGKSRLFAEEKPSGGETKPPSAVETAASSFPVGIVSSVIAPIAALTIARQALSNRDKLREEVAITEKDLTRIRKDLASTDRIISVSTIAAPLALSLFWLSFFFKTDRSEFIMFPAV